MKKRISYWEYKLLTKGLEYYRSHLKHLWKKSNKKNFDTEEYDAVVALSKKLEEEFIFIENQE